jgi:hypothetical protein
MALVMSPNCSSMLNSHGGIKHLHPELEDHPRVAAIDDGGPPMDPGNEDANDIAGTRFLCPEWTQAKVPCGS